MPIRFKSSALRSSKQTEVKSYIHRVASIDIHISKDFSIKGIFFSGLLRPRNMNESSCFYTGLRTRKVSKSKDTV